MRRWFLPKMPDLIGLLGRQAAVTLEGVEAFAAWSHGDRDAGQRVRELEHTADDAKRAVRQALRSAFTTPLDPEDLYELSERTDAVLNAAKNIVREAELLDLTPDEFAAAMADALVDGQRHLVEAFRVLQADPDRATAESDAAVGAIKEVERVYHRAMSAVLGMPDLRELAGRRELYRRYERTGDALESVAERVWYAVVKSP